MHNNASVPTFVSTTAEIAILTTAMKTVNGFRMPDAVTNGVKLMAGFVKDGKTDSAVKAGVETIKAGRAILGAFLRNSVLDQEAKGSASAKTARFNLEIRDRMNHHDGPYDGDIIAQLEKVRGEFVEAMKTEHGPIFTERIKAYNAMNAALRAADDKQKQLDRTRAISMTQKVKTGEMLGKRAQGASKPNLQRAETIVAREAQAKALLELL